MSMVFIVVKYTHPEAELHADCLVTTTTAARYRPFVGYREIRDRQLSDDTRCRLAAISTTTFRLRPTRTKRMG